MVEAIDDGPAGLRRRGFLAGLTLPVLASGAARAETHGLTVVGKDGWLFPLWDNLRRLDTTALQTATKALNDAVALFKAARIEVAVALLPSKARLYRRFLPADMVVAPEVDRRYGMVLAELRKPGTLAPDLDAPFTRAAAGADPLYFKADTHWTPAGATLAATEVANAIKAKNRLPASPRPGVRLAPPVPSVHPIGDLPRFLPPAERAKYGPEPYNRVEVASSGAAGLLEDDSADVAVIGNSFMEPRYGFTPTLSSLLARPVSLFWKPNNIGVYSTLVSYVGSDSFKRQRPKLIVIGFLEVDMTSPPNNSSWGQNAMTSEAFLAGLRSGLGV